MSNPSEKWGTVSALRNWVALDWRGHACKNWGPRDPRLRAGQSSVWTPRVARAGAEFPVYHDTRRVTLAVPRGPSQGSTDSWVDLIRPVYTLHITLDSVEPVAGMPHPFSRAHNRLNHRHAVIVSPHTHVDYARAEARCHVDSSHPFSFRHCTSLLIVHLFHIHVHRSFGTHSQKPTRT